MKKKSIKTNYPITSVIKECISKLPSEVQSKFYRMLEAEKDKQNINAIVSELKFGTLLAQGEAIIAHEKKMDSLTPDWTLSINQNISIFEVYRLGKSNKDNKIDEIYDLIGAKIETLSYSIYVEISVHDSCLTKSIEEIQSPMSDVYKWLENNRNNLYATQNFEKLFELTIVKVHTSKSHILCIYGPRIIDQKPHKLKQTEKLKDNEITKKLKKYANIISEYKVPYFLCVDIDFASGFHYSDFEEYFFYQSAEFLDYDSHHLHLPEVGKKWSILGEFYNAEIRKNLSGLLIIDDNIIKTLINPCKEQRIHSKRYKDLIIQIRALDNTKLYDRNIPENFVKMVETINEDSKNF